MEVGPKANIHGQWERLLTLERQDLQSVNFVSEAEWSKAVDLRPTLFGGAGSNPARNIIKMFTAIVYVN